MQNRTNRRCINTDIKIEDSNLEGSIGDAWTSQWKRAYMYVCVYMGTCGVSIFFLQGIGSHGYVIMEAKSQDLQLASSKPK